MDGVKDVAPEIIEAILKDFEKSMSSPSVVMQQLEQQAKQIGANYSLAYRYAGEVNNALNKAIRDNLTTDVLPDGNLYYNIAERVFGVTLERGHDFVSDFAKTVQSSINKENGVGLRPVSAPFNEERAKGIAKSVAYNRFDPTPYDEVVQKKISDATENYLLNSVDETIRENAELHSSAGLHAVIKRIVSSSEPCEWCQKLQGTYDYEDVKGTGNPVFRRHTRCHCIVLYKSSKDTDWLDVHTKYDSYSDEEVQKRIEYSITDNFKRKALSSGGRILDPEGEYEQKWAESYYEEIRHKSTDYKKIAKRLDIEEDKIYAIKRYLFFEGTWYNDIERREERFVPDAAIAQSWQRLAEGKEILPHDLTLIKHEQYEMQIKKENPGISHDEAHTIASLKYDYGKESREYYDHLNKRKKNR